jgi:hypothetical protein
MLATNVKRKRRVEVKRCSAVRFFDLEAAWDQYYGQTHPESAV